MESLATAGIPAFPRGLRHASLLRFFGPFVPAEILVPEPQATPAEVLLEPLLVSGTLNAAVIAEPSSAES